MNTIKHVLSLILLFVSITVFAQSSAYDIHNTTVSEKFNDKDELQSRRIWASGVRDDEVLNMDITVDANNIVKELTINDQKIMPPMVSEFKELTNFVIKYVDGEVQYQPVDTKKTTTERPEVEGEITEDDKRALMDLIKENLIKDELIDNPKVFDFMLTYDSLYINAKKQDQAVFKKYSALYERNSAIPLSRGTSFQITQTL
ncbi:MAG: hypothetical protein AB8G11_05815 [Saprospiraceae bacterium]